MLFTLVLSVALGLAEEIKLVRNCGSPDRYNKLVSQNQSFRQEVAELDTHTQELYGLWANGTVKVPEPITIPVVVHVVYENSAEKLSQEQIESQIAVLNRDFGTKYLTQVPERFRSLAAKSEIQFRLATRDPLGKATTGITYTPTKVPVFSDGDNDAIKSGKTGGHTRPV